MKKDIFSIPNILSFVRILLIPIFVWLYVTAGTSGEYYLAAAVVVASGITDFLDGQIARRCNMITEFGKFLDPLADKLLVTACMMIFVGWGRIWLLKDGFMAIMGLVLLKTKQTKLDGARWYGKVCTAIIYIAVLALLFFPGVFPEGSPASSLLILICIGVMLLSGILYSVALIKMWLHNETIAKENRMKLREIAKESTHEHSNIKSE